MQLLFKETSENDCLTIKPMKEHAFIDTITYKVLARNQKAQMGVGGN